MTTTHDLTAADVREGDVLVSYSHRINGIHGTTVEVGEEVVSVSRETHSVLNASSTGRVDVEFAVLKCGGPYRSTHRLPLDRAVRVQR